ncbi:MAG: Na/Pi cotransporter family protein, partial [Eubacteriales bacterium]
KIAKNSGIIVLGLGMLFVGISMMSDAVYPLRDSETFRVIITELNNPILAILVGLVFTVIIQSSSASVGITQAFAAAGLVELPVAIYLIMGMAIGTCVTPIIASFTASRDGKRTALMSLVFNVVRVILFAVALAIFPQIITFFEKLSPGDVSRQIANAHMISSIVAVLIQLPFSSLIVKLSYLMVPVKPEEMNKVEKKLIYLTKGVELSPSIAISQAKREACRMGKIARDNLELALKSFFTKDEKPTETVFDTEKTINYLNHEITACLVSFRALELSHKDLNKLGMMFRVVSDIERIGDHAENIAEYTVLENVKSANISELAMGEIKEIAEAALKVVDLALDVYRDENHDMLSAVSELEEHVDDLHEKFTDNHVARLMNDKCDPLGGVVFTDILTDLERVSDHAINIAYAIVEEKPHVLKVYS